MTFNHKTDTSRVDARRKRLRRWWLTSGAVMWLLVAAVVLFPRHRPPAGKEEQLAPLVLDPASAPAGNSDAESQAKEPAKKGEGAQAAWDPKGVKDFEFTDRDGKKVTKADLLGHPWLICFVFTRCAGPCPKVSDQMAKLQDLVKGTNVRLVTLTVDPDFDTAEILDRQAQSLKADPEQWYFLRGDKAETYRLISESFRMPVMETEGPNRQPGFEVIHSTNIMLVNEQGVVVQKYNALLEAEIVRLRRDLRPYLHARQPLVAPVPQLSAAEALVPR